MDHRSPSPSEMRARISFAGSVLIGIGVAAALWAATRSVGITAGIALTVTVTLMVLFTRGTRRRGAGPAESGPLDEEDARDQPPVP